jgi:urease accessory protein
MNDTALYQLLTWTSPAYPIGAFSYSHGLEWAVEAGSVTGLADLLKFIEAVLVRGGGWVDAVLFAQVWRATAGTSGAPGNPGAEVGTTALERCMAEIEEWVELAGAFRGSAETALESRQQGTAFLQVTRRAWPHPLLDIFARRWGERPLAHCAATALACAAHGIDLEPALRAYLHSFASNLVSAGARLIPLGQTAAQIAIAQLTAVIERVASHAPRTGIDELGTAAPLLELGSCLHETQYTRLFRS